MRRMSWAATNGADGVGLMFSQIDDAIVGGIDLDGCRDPDTETIESSAQEVIDRFRTYTETSPSRDRREVTVHLRSR